MTDTNSEYWESRHDALRAMFVEFLENSCDDDGSSEETFERLIDMLLERDRAIEIHNGLHPDEILGPV